MSASPSNARAERQSREDTEAFIASWRARGGYEGALERLNNRGGPSRMGPAPNRASAAIGHMPFPHKHCGEWR